MLTESGTRGNRSRPEHDFPPRYRRLRHHQQREPSEHLTAYCVWKGSKEAREPSVSGLTPSGRDLLPVDGTDPLLGNPFRSSLFRLSSSSTVLDAVCFSSPVLSAAASRSSSSVPSSPLTRMIGLRMPSPDASPSHSCTFTMSTSPTRGRQSDGASFRSLRSIRRGLELIALLLSHRVLPSEIFNLATRSTAVSITTSTTWMANLCVHALARSCPK